MYVRIDIKSLAKVAIEYSHRKERYSDFLIQLCEQALLLWEENQTDKAIEKCEEVISIHPQLQLAYLLKALLHTSNKNYVESLKNNGLYK